MNDQLRPVHTRPFFPTVQDFAGATVPHFQFLVDEYGYLGPYLEEQASTTFDISYCGDGTAVLLAWEVTGGFFGCSLVPRLRDGTLVADPDQWLSPNEILGARGARAEWVTQADLEDVDAAGYARTMERVAANLRGYCSDVLRGDWLIHADAQRWFDQHPNG